jgi:hypothetical protein
MQRLFLSGEQLNSTARHEARTPPQNELTASGTAAAAVASPAPTTPVASEELSEEAQKVLAENPNLLQDLKVVIGRGDNKSDTLFCLGDAYPILEKNSVLFEELYSHLAKQEAEVRDEPRAGEVVVSPTHPSPVASEELSEQATALLIACPGLLEALQNCIQHGMNADETFDSVSQTYDILLSYMDMFLELYEHANDRLNQALAEAAAAAAAEAAAKAAAKAEAAAKAAKAAAAKAAAEEAAIAAEAPTDRPLQIRYIANITRQKIMMIEQLHDRLPPLLRQPFFRFLDENRNFFDPRGSHYARFYSVDIVTRELLRVCHQLKTLDDLQDFLLRMNQIRARNDTKALSDKEQLGLTFTSFSLIQPGEYFETRQSRWIEGISLLLEAEKIRKASIEKSQQEMRDVLAAHRASVDAQNGRTGEGGALVVQSDAEGFLVEACNIVGVVTSRCSSISNDLSRIPVGNRNFFLDFLRNLIKCLGSESKRTAPMIYVPSLVDLSQTQYQSLLAVIKDFDTKSAISQTEMHMLIPIFVQNLYRLTPELSKKIKDFAICYCPDYQFPIIQALLSISTTHPMWSSDEDWSQFISIVQELAGAAEHKIPKFIQQVSQVHSVPSLLKSIGVITQRFPMLPQDDLIEVFCRLPESHHPHLVNMALALCPTDNTAVQLSIFRTLSVMGDSSPVWFHPDMQTLFIEVINEITRCLDPVHKSLVMEELKFDMGMPFWTNPVVRERTLRMINCVLQQANLYRVRITDLATHVACVLRIDIALYDFFESIIVANSSDKENLFKHLDPMAFIRLLMPGGQLDGKSEMHRHIKSRKGLMTKEKFWQLLITACKNFSLEHPAGWEPKPIDPAEIEANVENWANSYAMFSKAQQDAERRRISENRANQQHRPHVEPEKLIVPAPILLESEFPELEIPRISIDLRTEDTLRDTWRPVFLAMVKIIHPDKSPLHRKFIYELNRINDTIKTKDVKTYGPLVESWIQEALKFHRGAAAAAAAAS